METFDLIILGFCYLLLGFSMFLLVWGVCASIKDEIFLPKKYKKHLKEIGYNREQYMKEREEYHKNNNGGKLSRSFAECDVIRYELKTRRDFFEKNKSLFAKIILDNMAD